MKVRFVCACLAWALCAALLHSAEPAKQEAKPKEFTDPAKAGVDFKLQGEYEGTAGDKKVGLQVVALGEGSFDLVFLTGGLPGAGWNGKDRDKVTGKLDAGKVKVANKDGASGELSDGQFTGKHKDVAFTLKKVTRTSPTLGEKPPTGAVILFDGSEASLKEWDKGKFDDEKNLTTMVPGGLLTQKKFKDCKIHVEFRTPFMPYARGQGRGNSGVYLSGGYECQVLDSFGLTGEHNECGGLYMVSKPAVNMCFPPLSWQTYDIEFTAPKFEGDKRVAPAKMTVIHNGVKIQENIEFTKGITTAAPIKESPNGGPIHLQNHGNPVSFRNVWLVEKK